MSTPVVGAIAAPAAPVAPQQPIAFTPGQLEHLAALIQGRRTERPTRAELDAMPPDQQEDELRRFYLDEHEGDDPAAVRWRYERAQKYAIRDPLGRYYTWDIYKACDPANDEVPIAEYHDYDLRKTRERAERVNARAARSRAEREAAQERAIQEKVDQLQRAAFVEEEAQRRFEAAQAAKAKGKGSQGARVGKQAPAQPEGAAGS